MWTMSGEEMAPEQGAMEQETQEDNASVEAAASQRSHGCAPTELEEDCDDLLDLLHRRSDAVPPHPLRSSEPTPALTTSPQLPLRGNEPTPALTQSPQPDIDVSNKRARTQDMPISSSVAFDLSDPCVLPIAVWTCDGDCLKTTIRRHVILG